MTDPITSIDITIFVSKCVNSSNLSQRGIQVELILMKSFLHVIFDDVSVTESLNEVSLISTQ